MAYYEFILKTILVLLLLYIFYTTTMTTIELLKETSGKCVQQAHTNLLFEPFPGESLVDRTDVPLLNTKYVVYREALAALVADWLDGKVGTGAPTDKWEQDIIRAVNDNVNRVSKETDTDNCGDVPGDQTDELDEETRRVYDALLAIKVQNHLKMSTSHRRWIQRSYEFCVKIGVKFSDKMPALIRQHDLSKYTHREVLGYAVMFGDEQVGWKQLEDAEEKNEWETTLHNHYAANPHHPEYFYPKLSDGTRDQSKTMLELDTENGKDYLDESAIDMLAARGERMLKDDAVISVKKWMDIQEQYCARYARADREHVMKKIEEWQKMAADFLKDEINSKNMNGHFDKRQIVAKL